MKIRFLFLLSLCLVEIYCQRLRTTSTNEDASKEEPRAVRTRGRSRFSSTEEGAQIQQSSPATTNRRASTRTRIHSNNPKAAAERRAQSVQSTQAPRGYAVDEINNDSPIDSFRRQSKPRLLTESRFEVPTVTVGRRPILFETSTPVLPLVEELPVEELGFGSTARAILQSRGEPLPAKTTTPVVDEAYLLNNFGGTIRSLAAASRNAQATLSRTRYDVAVQRATPLRSEVPILDREDITFRRTGLRGDPLPSLRGSDINLERETPTRSRNSARGKVTEPRSNARLDSETLVSSEPSIVEDFVRTNSRTNGRSKSNEVRANTMLESEKTVTPEASIVEDFVRVDPETEAPEPVQGLQEQSELVTETQFFDDSAIDLPNEDDIEVKKNIVEIITSPRSVSISPPRRVALNSRRGSTRNSEELEVTAAPRTRASRTRPTRRPEESNASTTASSRSRMSRRRFDEPSVAESRYRGPSVFTAEQYRDVTARTRTGRRIDSQYESVPERITVDLNPTTIRSRSTGRRATTSGSTTTERPSGTNSRGRSRSRSRSNEPTSPPAGRSSGRRTSYVEEVESGGRRASLIDDTGSSRRKLANGESSRPSSRRINADNGRDTSGRNEVNELRTRSNSAETPIRRRGSRIEMANAKINERLPLPHSEKETLSRLEVIETRKRTPSRNLANRPTEPVEETTIYYGEKSRKTDPPDTTIPPTTTEKNIPKSNFRSRTRFPEVPPRIDESKLEVLPLFEREPKAIASTRSRGRSRSSLSRRNSEDHMHVSATENDVKFVEKPTTSAFTRITVTRAESVEASTSRARISTRTASPSTTETPRISFSSSTVPITRAASRASITTTGTPETTTKWVTRSPPIIKESVIAEINQVTSKSTITRRKKVPKAKAVEMLSRGTKKAEIKSSDVGKKKSSEEDIDEEDNYPEPFKALIQKKKFKEEPRPTQSSSRSAAVKITSTERVIVTSAGTPRGSSTARVVTTTTVAPKELNEIINDIDNELEPKQRITATVPTTTTRSRTALKFPEKPKYQQRQKDKLTKSTEKPRYSAEKQATKTTSFPRKPYSTKTYSTRGPVEHHPRRKVLRSTAFPPSTTPLNFVIRENKFSAKFIKKEDKALESNNNEKSFKQPKGLYSSRKSDDKENEESSKQMDVSLIQNPKPLKKFNSSRYSSRYRGESSTRSSVLKSTTSTPFYIPTIPTPAYLPTVPSITPSSTPVDGILAVKDDDLGVEVISFDDPVNTIPSSADLVNGEYLTTDKNLKLSPMVKDGTTEKPVSIIERIINSIQGISTTGAPNTTTPDLSSPTTNEATGNSAILKLATKKQTSKDKTGTDVNTNIIETITSEKPTTIIEKIRSSLTAIQTNEVGTSDFNTVSSSSSTTPLSTVTKYSAKYRGSSVGTTALPAPLPLSTSIKSLSVFDEINENQVLEKKTIGKLLNILNGLVSTESPGGSEKLVVVTPKNVLSSGGFVATTFSPQEPIEAISLNGLELRTSFSDIPSSSTSESISTVNIETTTSESTSVNTEPSTISIVNTDLTTSSTDKNDAPSSSTSTETLMPETTDTPTPTTMIRDTTTSTPSIRYTKTPLITTDIPPTETTTMEAGTTFNTLQSTFPSIPTFEVSPGSVSIFSANDLSNYITPEDYLFNTVTIASRVGFDNNMLTSTSTEGITSTTAEPTTNTESATVATTTDIDASSTMPSITTTDSTLLASTVVDATTLMMSTTVSEESTTMLTTTMSSNTSNSSANPPNRSGRILSGDIGEPVENSIDVSTPSTTTSTTPDYFIFAVLNNNTILRKRPPTVPNKETPFIIVGLFPNNTIVRKFPNGTVVPMDPVIKVRGFDIRPNPPPLVEITSNQVTDTTNGMTTPDNNSATVESNRMARLLANEQRTTDSMPRVVITSTTAKAPVSTNSVSSTSTNDPTMTSTTISMPSTTSVGSTMMPLTTIPTTLPSTTTPGTTIIESTSSPSMSPITMQTSNMNVVPNIVEIIAVPGETRISKSQTTTSAQSSTVSSSNVEASTVASSSTEASTMASSRVESSTEHTSSSTMSQSTETIPPTLGEILNGRTVDALNNIIKSAEATSSKPPNYKTLHVNQYNEVLNIQDLISRKNGNIVYRWKPVTKTEYKSIKNSITSSSTESSTITTAPITDSEAPFTSSILNAEQTTQIPNVSKMNSVASSTTDSITKSTAQFSDGEAPFTSSILNTEPTTQIPNSSDRLVSSTLISTIMPVSSTTSKPTTQSTTTTTTQTTTTAIPEITTTRKIETTTRRLTTTMAPKTSTGFPTFTPASIVPSILTTLFPNLMRGVITTPESPISSTRRILSGAELTNNIGDRFEVLSAAGSTARPTTVLPQSSTSQRISTTTRTTPSTTTTQVTTTTRPTTTQTTTQSTTTTTTTTTQKPRTTTVKPNPTISDLKVSNPSTTMGTKEETDKLFDELKKSGKLKNLNEEQRKSLEEIERIEKEQAELLKQLTLLTTMFGGQNGRTPNPPSVPVGGSSNSLANRIISIAMARDPSRQVTTNPPPSTTTTKKPTRTTTKRPNSIQDQLPITQLDDTTKRSTPSLEDVLKQYNLEGLSTPTPLTSTYGKTDEALLAAILKEQGIGPTTPKSLGDNVNEAGVFKEATTTKKPKPRARPAPTTTARPIGGGLMRGLNWLLDVLDPPTTKKPAPRRSKPKTTQTPKPMVAEEELLTNQPTRITPMITAAPVTKPSLSQAEIQVLIKQLETAQNNPSAADQLDFSKIKSLQNLINVNEGVQVTNTGQHGATSRATPRPKKVKSTTEWDPFLTEINERKPKASTVSTLSVSNSIDDDVELISTTVRNRVMPPVSLNPIPGIDGQGDSMIRSNLLTAAVNVTRAISSFLGSALQGATRGFRSLVGSGSSMVGNIAQTSSAVAG